MHDTSISATKLIAAGGWVLAGLFVVAAWVVYAETDGRLAVMVALTGCPFVAIALVAQIRLYTMRVCGLLRAVSDLERASSEIHAIR